MRSVGRLLSWCLSLSIVLFLAKACSADVEKELRQCNGYFYALCMEERLSGTCLFFPQEIKLQLVFKWSAVSNKSVGLIWIKAAGNSATGAYKERRVCWGRHFSALPRLILCALCRMEHSGETGVERAGSQRTNPCSPLFCFWVCLSSLGWGLGTANLCCDAKLSEVIISQLVDPVFPLVPLLNDMKP